MPPPWDLPHNIQLRYCFENILLYLLDVYAPILIASMYLLSKAKKQVAKRLVCTYFVQNILHMKEIYNIFEFI